MMTNASHVSDKDTLTHSVGASYIRCLIDVCGEAGVSQPDLLRLAGLQVDEVADDSTHFPLRKMLALLKAGRELTGDNFIGLHMGQKVRPKTFGALGYAAMSCSNLGEAIALIPRYEQLVLNGGETRIYADKSNLTLAWRSRLPPHLENRSLNEAIVAGWISFGRWITGQQGMLKKVSFTHPKPESIIEYELFFDCPIEFDATENSATGAIEFAQLPLTFSDQQLNLLMEEQASSLLAVINKENDFTRQVTRHICSLLPKQMPSINVVAARLNISERTLRRKLMAEGVSFAEVLNRIRTDLACQYLIDTNLSLLDIALLVGFSEQSSFTRAFRHWTGDTPSGYRAAHRKTRRSF